VNWFARGARALHRNTHHLHRILHTIYYRNTHHLHRILNTIYYKNTHHLHRILNTIYYRNIHHLHRVAIEAKETHSEHTKYYRNTHHLHILLHKILQRALHRNTHHPSHQIWAQVCVSVKRDLFTWQNRPIALNPKPQVCVRHTHHLTHHLTHQIQQICSAPPHQQPPHRQ